MDEAGRTYLCEPNPRLVVRAILRVTAGIGLAALLVLLAAEFGPGLSGPVASLALLLGGFLGGLHDARRQRVAWRVTDEGLVEVFRFGPSTLYPWERLEHVVIEPAGARVMLLRGDLLLDHYVRHWRELVDEVQQQLWRRHGRRVPRARLISGAAISRAGDESEPEADRGLSLDRD